MQGVYFISGIDTDIGKSYATGILAKQLQQAGVSVITQKLIQTGNEQVSEDILTHRRLMGVQMLPEDEMRLTMPVVLSYPASPHLASRIDGVKIDLARIDAATQELSARYQVVLLEGAGGLMVPLVEADNAHPKTLLTLDYIIERDYPVILVTSGRLGSINHTLLSLQALKQHNVRLHALMYNEYHDHDALINADTKRFLQAYLQQHFVGSQWLQFGNVSSEL